MPFTHSIVRAHPTASRVASSSIVSPRCRCAAHRTTATSRTMFRIALTFGMRRLFLGVPAEVREDRQRRQLVCGYLYKLYSQFTRRSTEKCPNGRANLCFHQTTRMPLLIGMAARPRRCETSQLTAQLTAPRNISSPITYRFALSAVLCIRKLTCLLLSRAHTPPQSQQTHTHSA